MPDDPIAWRTIGDLIANSARRFGDAPAVWAHPSRVLSHRQLAAVQTAQVAALRAAGVAPGDRVAVVLPKSADTAAVSLVLASACCCVPLNPDATAPELTAALQRTHSRWLVAQPHSPAWQCGQALGLTCIGVAPEPAGGFRFEHPPPADRPVANATPAPGDTALLLQTSGSSAEPKLVPLSHHQLLCSTANLVRSLALGPQDRCLNMLPLFHVGGLVDLLLAPLAVGGSVLVTERIAAREFFAASAEFRPTWYQGVPTMLREVLSLAQLEPRRLADHRLRFIRSVSSALSERLQAELEATFDCPVIAIYGMTETAGVITSNPLPPGRAKPGSVGLPVGPQLRIARADGSWAAAGESGEICVRGDTVIGAYAQTDAPDEKAFFGDWLRTGDSGHLDADGYLFLDGRLKDIINRGGEKIAPLEIDRCLLQHPQVAEAAAFAAPHPTLGEEVALAV
ncbi:AMP-binding protein, partial [Immundisolibacter sp.]|uniref:AMP-binding protein n=1 Tax=Immundisolibacter sp. TaxID=1934948 RepID=UPI003F844990